MRVTLVLVALLTVIAAVVGLWTPWGSDHLRQVLTMLGFSACELGVTFLLSRLILRRKDWRLGLPARDPDREPAEAWSRLPLVLLVSAGALEAGVLYLGSRLGFSLAVEIFYYTVLLFLGWTLSRFARAKQYVAVLYPLLLLTAFALWDVVTFLDNDGAQFNYGPEIVIFAASHLASKLSLLPLDASVAWSGWYVAEISRFSLSRGFRSSEG